MILDEFFLTLLFYFNNKNYLLLYITLFNTLHVSSVNATKTKKSVILLQLFIKYFFQGCFKYFLYYHYIVTDINTFFSFITKLLLLKRSIKGSLSVLLNKNYKYNIIYTIHILLYRSVLQHYVLSGCVVYLLTIIIIM